jgi:hypothetical protein
MNANEDEGLVDGSRDSRQPVESFDSFRGDDFAFFAFFAD